MSIKPQRQLLEIETVKFPVRLGDAPAKLKPLHVRKPVPVKQSLCLALHCKCQDKKP